MALVRKEHTGIPVSFIENMCHGRECKEDVLARWGHQKRKYVEVPVGVRTLTWTPS